jgi:signal transduction histidine kinase
MLKILLISFLSILLIRSDVSAYQNNNQFNKDSLQSIFQNLLQSKPNKDVVDQMNNLAINIYPNDYLTALNITKKSLEFSNSINYNSGKAVAYHIIANCFNASGNYKIALAQINKADIIAQKINDYEIFSQVYITKGKILLSLNNYDEALFSFNQALHYLSQVNPNHKFNGEILQNIAILYRQKSKFNEALDYCNDAILSNNQVFDNFHLAENYLERAKTYQALSNYANAKEDAVKAIAYAEDAQNQITLVNSLNFLAQIAINFEEYAQANSLLKKALDLSKTNFLYPQQLDVYKLMGLLASKSDQYKKSYQIEKDYNSLFDSLNDASRFKQLDEYRIYYSVKEKQVENNLLKKDNLENEQKIQTKNYFIFFIIVLLLLSGILILLLIKRGKEIKKSNVILQDQNNQIKNQKEELESLNHLKNRFFSIVSHDLRGPILSLKGMLDLYHNQLMTEEETKYFMNELNQNFGNTATLIDNLLTWSKSQMKGEKLVKRKIDLLEITDQVIAIAQPKITEKQITIHNQIDQKFAYADEESVAVVIRNLVSNALKFVELGGTIHINSNIQNSHVLISIKDDGVGMTKEQVDKISNHTFYTTTGTQKEKGNGLGLFLCTEFVKKNGGEFWIESEKDKGSSFYFTLPLKKA